MTICNDGMTSKDPRVRQAFLIVEPDRTQFEDLTEWMGEGILRPCVDRVYSLERAAEAFDAKPLRGKSVVKMLDGAA